MDEQHERDKEEADFKPCPGNKPEEHQQVADEQHERDGEEAGSNLCPGNNPEEPQQLSKSYLGNKPEEHQQIVDEQHERDNEKAGIQSVRYNEELLSKSYLGNKSEEHQQILDEQHERDEVADNEPVRHNDELLSKCYLGNKPEEHQQKTDEQHEIDKFEDFIPKHEKGKNLVHKKKGKENQQKLDEQHDKEEAGFQPCPRNKPEEHQQIVYEQHETDKEDADFKPCPGNNPEGNQQVVDEQHDRDKEKAGIQSVRYKELLSKPCPGNKPEEHQQKTDEQHERDKHEDYIHKHEMEQNLIHRKKGKENQQKLDGQHERDQEKAGIQSVRHEELLSRSYLGKKPEENQQKLGEPHDKEEAGFQHVRENDDSRLNAKIIWILVPGFLSVALILFYLCSTSSVINNPSVLQIFQNEIENLRRDFPDQTDALWLRSQKILQKHLNKSNPLEPVTLILTAARDAEITLRCLSERLARAYSTSLNASYIVIDGPSKAAYDSADAKLQIDIALSSAFESTSRAAVLHRIEELPAGSLLILYKYCDHENAAFKNVTLVLTVLLDKPTLDPGLSLTELEEQVRDFLWEKFADPNRDGNHNEMNGDKLSGVWSRIAHLVLPVLPIETIETNNCLEDKTKQGTKVTG